MGGRSGFGPGSRSHYSDLGYSKNQDIQAYLEKIKNNMIPVDRWTFAPLIDNYITCFPKRNDMLTLTDIEKSSDPIYLNGLIMELHKGGYISEKDNGFILTSYGINWYQNLQEVLLSKNQRDSHLESVTERAKKLTDFDSFFNSVGTILR